MGGWLALAGAIILGPRVGKYGPDGKPRDVEEFRVEPSRESLIIVGGDAIDTQPRAHWVPRLAPSKLSALIVLPTELTVWSRPQNVPSSPRKTSKPTR